MKQGYAKGLQSYFGLTDERGDLFINTVISAWTKNVQDKKLVDVNAVKHKTFLDAIEILSPDSISVQQIGLIGILIEQAYNATREKPKYTVFGNLK